MTENVLFALIGITMAMMARGIFVLAGVIEGLRYLLELTEQDKGQLAVLRKQAIEGLVLLILISGLSFAMFLFAHEGVM